MMRDLAQMSYKPIHQEAGRDLELRPQTMKVFETVLHRPKLHTCAVQNVIADRYPPT